MAEENLRERRDHRDLQPDEWGALIKAFRDMRRRREYIPFATAHDELFFTGIHREFFVPWHRDFINNLELALRMDGNDVAIPYWNWEASPTVPTQLDSFRAELGLSASEVESVGPLSYGFARDETTWSGFNQAMGSGPHGAVHIAIGGVMATGRSPADPLFWLHHGYIDKVWADWQKGSNNKLPDNLEDTMPRSPYPETPKKVKDAVNTRTLGYIHVPHAGGVGV